MCEGESDRARLEDGRRQLLFELFCGDCPTDMVRIYQGARRKAMHEEMKVTLVAVSHLYSRLKSFLYPRNLMDSLEERRDIWTMVPGFDWGSKPQGKGEDTQSIRDVRHLLDTSVADESLVSARP